jgi:hypothetical protein
MKGPMTTQSLRGLPGQGPLHWRGDKTNAIDELDVVSNFLGFSPAFVGLLGRATEPSPAEFDAFSDFVMTLVYPPNPIKSLTDVGTVSEEDGRTAFLTAPTGGGVLACAPCHALPSGTNGFSLDLNVAEAGSQGMKIPHLRNMYDKVGAYGVAGDQVSGFGFLHDGTEYSMFDFLTVGAFTFSGTEQADIENFQMVVDTGFKPIVGQQVSVLEGNFNDAAIVDRVNLMLAQADLGNTDVVVKGVFDGERRGFVYVGGGVFQQDRVGAPNLTTTAVRTLAATSEQEQVFTAVPVGTGTRIGINRDEDAHLDGDDNCPGIPNNPQTDTDGNGIGDPCEPVPVPEPGVTLTLFAALPLLRWMKARRERE